MYVLILDDVELNNALMIQAVGEIQGCTTRAFTAPAEALAFVQQHAAEIGLAISDYDMPDMNGIAFIKAARAVAGFEHVPIMMVTSMDQRRVRREALEAGATEFLAKPFDAIEVRARVNNLLALNRARIAEHDRAAWLASEVAAAVSEIEAREREIVMRLVRAAEYRDTDTGDHVSRVAGFVALIARHLGYDPPACKRLALASTMHDIGKIAVPDAILLKKGPLTPEERAQITQHARNGHAILEGSSSDVVRLAAEIAISHHERWDGTGYPHGLAGEDIPQSGRIVAVADVFDALVSDRPYKQAWAVDDAKGYLIAASGSQFDPRCVSAFVESWAEVLRIRGAPDPLPSS